MAHGIVTGGALESSQIMTAGSVDLLTGASWGEGDGLNGEVLQPESLDSLSEILDRVEFEASVDSTSYVLNSSLRSKFMLLTMMATNFSNTMIGQMLPQANSRNSLAG